MQLSEQQQTVVDWCKTEDGSCNVIARAGTGKSTLLLEVSKIVQGRAYLGAFNKSIAQELQDRLGSSNKNVTAGTMHSLGYSIWRKTRSKCEVDGRKVNYLARNLFPYDKPCANAIADAVGYAKLAGFGLSGIPNTEENWTALIEQYDLWDEIPESVSPTRILDSCKKVYQKSLDLAQESTSKLDFADMILLPLMFSDPTGTYDWVMQDEAQDLSETRRRLMYHVLRPEGRILAVGDPAQCIYQFAGSSHNSMDLLKDDLKSIELPLNVTYRCPQSIVKMAQQWVPDFTAHPSSPEGLISRLSHTKFWDQELHTNDVILCRNTRPLLGIAQRLRKAGIACVVEGASGKNLIALAEKWGDIDIGVWLGYLSGYEEKEIAKYHAKEDFERAEYVTEKCSMLRDICEDLNELASTRELVRKIEFIFGEDKDRDDVVRLCTIHRGKGREWDRVFLIGRNRYQPSKWAKTETDMQAERNLQYVAVTRVKKELVEVIVPKAPQNSKEIVEWWEL